MIITCPKCFSKYEVPDSAVAANGRVVRCTSCAMEWVAYPNDSVDPEGVALDEALKEVGSAVREAVEHFDIDSRLVEQDLAGEPVSESQADDDDYDDYDAMFIDELDGDAGEQEDEPEEIDLDEIDFAAIDTSDEELDLNEDDLMTGLLGDVDEEEDFMTRRRLQELDRDDRERSHRRSWFVTIGFGVWVATVLVILGTLIFAKETVTSKFPGTIQLYEFAAGLSDWQLFGSDDEGPRFVEPKPKVLSIKPASLVPFAKGADTWITAAGKITNMGQQSVQIEKLVVVIQDSNHRPIAEQTFEPTGKILGRGSVLDYELTYGPLPDGFAFVHVDVMFAGGKRYSDIQAARSNPPAGGAR